MSVPHLRAVRDDLPSWTAIVALHLERYRGNTLSTYRRAIAAWTSWCAANELDPLTASGDVIARFIAEAGGRPGSQRLRLAALSSLYATAIEQDLIDGPAPTTSIKRPRSVRRRRSLTSDQTRELEILAQRRSLQDLAVVQLLLRVGLRPTEVCELTVADLNLNARTCTLSRGPRSSVTFDVDEPTVTTLSAHLGRRRSGYVVMREQRQTSRSAIWHLVDSLAGEAGLPLVSADDLRMSGVTPVSPA